MAAGTQPLLLCIPLRSQEDSEHEEEVEEEEEEDYEDFAT